MTLKWLKLRDKTSKITWTSKLNKLSWILLEIECALKCLALCKNFQKINECQQFNNKYQNLVRVYLSEPKSQINGRKIHTILLHMLTVQTSRHDTTPKTTNMENAYEIACLVIILLRRSHDEIVSFFRLGLSSSFLSDSKCREVSKSKFA